MAASQAIPTIGILLRMSSNTNTSTATSNFTTIGEIISFDGPDSSRTSIDITHNNPDGLYREFIPGLIDMGEFGGEIQYAPRDTTHGTAGLLDDWTSGSGTAPTGRRGNRLWYLQLTDDYAAPTETSQAIYFRGHLNRHSWSMPHDDKVTARFSIKLSGQPTITTL